MKLKDFAAYQQSDIGLKNILLTWEKIQSNYYSETDKYLQWLVFKIILAYGDYENPVHTISNMALDQNFNPLSCAGPHIPDLFVVYEGKGYVLEVTERPIHGKIEHFSHIDWAVKKYGLNNCLGCLVTRTDTERVPPEVWSTFKAELEFSGRLFMISGVKFLLDLLRLYGRDSGKKFVCFLEKSEEIWKKKLGWKNIKNLIVILQRTTLEK